MIVRQWHRPLLECVHRLGLPFTLIDDPPFQVNIKNSIATIRKFYA
jgi:hypothetical protein